MNYSNLKINYIVLLFVIMISSCATTEKKDAKAVTAKIISNWDNLDRYWIKSNTTHPKYPKSAFRAMKNACVTVVFTIGEDGLVYDPVVARILPESDKGFEQASLKAIKKFTFEPAEGNIEKNRVITSNTFSFYIMPSDNAEGRKRMDKFETEFVPKCKINLEAL